MTTTSARRPPQRGEDIIQQETTEKSRRTGIREWWIPKGSTFTGKMREALKVGAIGADKQIPFNGQPWVTPILGSGPLGLPSEFVDQTGHLPTAVVLKARKAWPDSAPDLSAFTGIGADIDCWLADFTYTMISQRVVGADQNLLPQPGVSSAEAEALSERLEPAAALLVLVAAQLTRTFHRMSLDTCRPISRWGSERAAMPGAHDRRLDLDDEYVYLLIEACGAANTALETYAKHHAKQDENLATTLASIRALVEGIATAAQANPATVSLVHLEQITEAAWLLVVDSLAGSAYPGWTSLLLRLVLSDDNNTDFVRPRWLDMQTLSNAVHDIVNPMSKVSWEFGNIRERQANRDLYDSVAQTLWAQNEVRETIRSQPKLPQSVLPARPVAYVSSFDYELEMALWRTAAEYKHARSFSVVFPAYAVTEGDPHLGTFVWLEAVVEASASASDSVGHRDLSDFETMRTVKKFRLLDSATDVSSYEDHPIVVRIVGCPLLKLPESIDKDLADDLEDAQLPDVAGFVHAVTVDEYLALRQTERDWVWSFTESHRGLPNKYFDSGRSAPRKYWMVLGVPFRDPAIRLRVMSVLARNDGGKAKSPEEPKGKNNKAPVVPADQAATDSVAPLSGAKYPSLLSAPTSKVLDSSPSAPEEPRHGVAINTRTDDEEIMLLNSLGFPVIRGTCESFTEDLKAHAAELAKAAAKYAPKEDQS